MNIYLASSWRNEFYQVTLNALRRDGFKVYDFKERGFEWHEVIESNKERQKIPSHQWKVGGAELSKTLKSPMALEHFAFDADALKKCDALVLLLPCGRSAHLEAGFAMGQSKPTFIYVPPGVVVEPELMYLLGGSGDEVFSNFKTLLNALAAEKMFIENEANVFR